MRSILSGVAGASTLELVEAAEAIARELAGRDPAHADAVAMECAERLGRAIDLLEVALAGAVARVDDTGAFAECGFSTTGAWLRTRLGMRDGRAAERVRLARQLPRLPQVGERARAGVLPVGFAGAIADAVARLDDADAPVAEEALLGLVDAGCTAGQLAKDAAQITDLINTHRGKEKEPRESRRGFCRSWITKSRSLDGGSWFRGWLTPEHQAAFDQIISPLAKPKAKGDDRDLGQRTADALMAVLTQGHSGAGVTVIIDLEAFTAATGDTGPFTATSGGGPGTGAQPPTGAAGTSASDTAGSQADVPGAQVSDTAVTNAGHSHTGTSHTGGSDTGSSHASGSRVVATDGAAKPGAARDARRHSGQSAGLVDAAGSCHDVAGEPPIDGRVDEDTGDRRNGAGATAALDPQAVDARSNQSPPAMPGSATGVPAGASAPWPETSSGSRPSRRNRASGPDTDPLTGAGGAAQTGHSGDQQGRPDGMNAYAGAHDAQRSRPLRPGRRRLAARLLDGTPISPERARQIALNAGINVLLLGRSGLPLYLGRTVRFATPAQRKALLALYETCCVQGCQIPAHLCEIHHLDGGWKLAAPTDIDKLAPACGWHNRWCETHPDRVVETRDHHGRTTVHILTSWQKPAATAA